MNSHQNTITSASRVQITEIVVDSLRELLLLGGNGSSAQSGDITEETRLIGRDSVLDSMGLVNLIVEIEQRLEDEFDISLVLADDRAMSQKNSPFRSVQSLSDYIYQLVAEQS